jgi:hypothetical protein
MEAVRTAETSFDNHFFTAVYPRRQLWSISTAPYSCNTNKSTKHCRNSDCSITSCYSVCWTGLALKLHISRGKYITQETFLSKDFAMWHFKLSFSGVRNEKFERPPFWDIWSYQIKNYGVEVTFTGLNSVLNFIKIYQFILKLVGALRTSETSVYSSETTPHYIPEGCDLQIFALITVYYMCRDISITNTSILSYFHTTSLCPWCRHQKGQPHPTVAVRHHLAGVELLLSSRYTVPLPCSYCCSSREHEFLDLREFLRAIELLRAVKEN